MSKTFSLRKYLIAYSWVFILIAIFADIPIYYYLPSPQNTHTLLQGKVEFSPPVVKVPGGSSSNLSFSFDVGPVEIVTSSPALVSPNQLFLIQASIVNRGNGYIVSPSQYTGSCSDQISVSSVASGPSNYNIPPPFVGYNIYIPEEFSTEGEHQVIFSFNYCYALFGSLSIQLPRVYQS
ncbi:MAG: hypothetical protein QXJ93_00725 [Candidatus Rehaiarchaeum fermentans]|nr:hypothetical protein [Candidatus Rehaiarchaeum fermentans]